MKRTRVWRLPETCSRTNQRAAKVAVHLLEPKAPDSFVAWGFFNAIFEQKEYAESYVMEEIGARMLAEDERLRGEFEKKIATDSTFARRPQARLNWLYLHSKWADRMMNVYPVGKLMHWQTELVTRPVRSDGRGFK